MSFENYDDMTDAHKYVSLCARAHKYRLIVHRVYKYTCKCTRVYKNVYLCARAHKSSFISSRCTNTGLFCTCISASDATTPASCLQLLCVIRTAVVSKSPCAHVCEQTSENDNVNYWVTDRDRTTVWPREQ
jgi:hypothetical protein